MKRKWTKKEAKKYIHMVNRMMIPFEEEERFWQLLKQEIESF